MTEPTPAATSVKVYIDTPGPTISVEAPEPLDVVAAKALDLYKSVMADWPSPPHKPLSGGSGFVTERAWE